ncbi:hypothetical protein BDV36DRAFT_299097 [Aspergillus pseudocaelatus]|uniref:Uncharacterized protein n=1 Tax=Aspergillus pseudocaelatus TaxID=1825620 RepID=A0ABQ6WCP9_9EURO|nr:hypothetical protein BDV36DRAFT_299097 [Aspergillus pseudocaelatus]
MSYMSELAEDLFTKVVSWQPDAQTMERISEALPELLKAFALKVGHTAPSQMHRDIMAFIHKNRDTIVSRFMDMCSPQEENLSDVGSGESEAMALDEKMDLLE